MMDREYINEQLLVERYLREDFPASEQTAFEQAYLSSGELLDDLEAAEKLQHGLRDLAALDRAQAAQAQPSWISSLFHSPRYAMAASFMLLVSLGVSSALLHRLDRVSDFGPAAMPAQIVPLVSVRSAPAAGSVNTVYLGARDRQPVLMIDPGYETYSRYRATVYRLEVQGAPSRVWQVDGMQPGYEDMLALGLPAQILEPGDYEIRLEGWRDEGAAAQAFEPVDALTFRVLADDPSP